MRPDEALITALIADMNGWYHHSGSRTLRSIYFGGGTPSLLVPSAVSTLIDEACRLWSPCSNMQITLEANPCDVNKQTWQAYAHAGVNRLSLGIQSFEPRLLRFLGRAHDHNQARQAARLARQIFTQFSLDLIFGMIGQNHNTLHRDLVSALDVCPDHISTYQLTIEPGTAFAAEQQRGKLKTLCSDRLAAFYEHIHTTLTANGFDHYEVSNFARPHKQSLHNLTYWQGEDYAGIGPGAHGRIRILEHRYATLNPPEPHMYKAHVQQQGWGVVEKTALTAREIYQEYVMTGLRLSTGVERQKLRRMGKEFSQQSLKPLLETGLIVQTSTHVQATKKGRLVLDTIIKQLLL